MILVQCIIKQKTDNWKYSKKKKVVSVLCDGEVGGGGLKTGLWTVSA